MSIYVACRCGQAFSAPLQLAGQTVGCPACGQALFVPQPHVPAPQGYPPSADPFGSAAGLGPVSLPSAAPRAATSTAPLLIGGAAIGVVALIAIVLLASGAFSSAPRPTNVVDLTPQLVPAIPQQPPIVVPLGTTPAKPQVTPPVAPPAATGQDAKIDKLLLAGMYQLDMPGSEMDSSDGPRQTGAGVSLSGGAHFKAQLPGDARSGRLVHVRWTILVRPQNLAGDAQPAGAQPITINGLTGYETRTAQPSAHQHELTFQFPDHSLTLSIRCPEDRLDLPEVQRVKQSLQRLKPVPTEILAMVPPELTKPAAVAQTPAPTQPAATTPDPAAAAHPDQLSLGRGLFTLHAPGAKQRVPEQAGGLKGGNEFFIGTAEMPSGLSLGWFLVYMPNRDSDLKTEVFQHFNKRGQLSPPGSENAAETPFTANGLTGMEKRFVLSHGRGKELPIIHRTLYLKDHALIYSVSGSADLLAQPEALEILNSLKKSF